jgi:hypothetical protein
MVFTLLTDSAALLFEVTSVPLAVGCEVHMNFADELA